MGAIFFLACLFAGLSSTFSATKIVSIICEAEKCAVYFPPFGSCEIHAELKKKSLFSGMANQNSSSLANIDSGRRNNTYKKKPAKHSA